MRSYLKSTEKCESKRRRERERDRKTKDGIAKSQKMCGSLKPIVSEHKIQLLLFAQTLTRTRTLTINKTVFRLTCSNDIFYAQFAKISFIISVLSVVFSSLLATVFFLKFSHSGKNSSHSNAIVGIVFVGIFIFGFPSFKSNGTCESLSFAFRP